MTRGVGEGSNRESRGRGKQWNWNRGLMDMDNGGIDCGMGGQGRGEQWAKMAG